MRILLKDHWKVAGAWPFTPLMGASMETGVILSGVTPVIDAHVPGSVYDDLLRAGLIPYPYYEKNSMLCEWVANRFWSYQTTFSVPAECAGKNMRLVFRGIDYHAHISLNQKCIGEHKGMYVPCIIDVTDIIKPGEENNLVVVLENAPDEMGQIGYTSRTFTQKARFGYKWDFGTRLINLGLYDIVYLDICDDPIEDLHIRYLGDGEVEITADNESISAEISFGGEMLASAESETINGRAHLTLKVENPKLWWPNGYGEQPLYDVIIRTKDDEKKCRVGMRTLEYKKPECADSTVLPYIPVINGKEIYIKGVNMTPLDHMYGCVGKERYQRLLSIAKSGYVNLIRVWGGGIIEKEEFYDLCDEYGFMVWQEFIQSSSGIDNIPSKRPEFLALCEKTARAVIPEKRNHTCLTFWSGGNELMDENGIPSTYEDENIAMLRAICEELSPEILMLPTSASGPTEWFDPNDPSRNQDIHGPWRYAGVEEQYSLYNNSTIILHSEFGVDGMSNLDSILTVLGPENRKITTMDENYVWRHHGEWWDSYSVRERPIFGDLRGTTDSDLSDLRVLVDLSQYMQAEGLRYAIEAHRRRSVTASPARLAVGDMITFPAQKNIGSIVWQINEPWPNVSCTCMVDYYEQPKLAFLFYADVQKPLHASMRYNKFLWKAGETFEGIVFVNDDMCEGYDCVTAEASCEGVKLAGNKITFTVPENAHSFTVTVKLTKGGYVDKTEYLFLIGEMGSAPIKPVTDFIKAYRESAKIKDSV